MDNALIISLLKDLGLTVVEKPKTLRKANKTTEKAGKHSNCFALEHGEIPIARIATYASQRCDCCGETETYYAGSYLKTSHARWKTERQIRASLPYADTTSLPLEVDQQADTTAIPYCFRCIATQLLIEQSLTAAPCEGEQLQLWS